ncbi:MAG: 16S rRNA (uracil(1498)-N(3))-methyltransferase [Pseudomonadota bacterium]
MTSSSPKIRLYLDATLTPGGEIALARDQSHYLFAVMRLSAGATVLVFNSRDGEWLAEAARADKRNGTLRAVERTRPAAAPPDLWLLFAPLKKARTDFVAEKACEMGCRRLIPVFTQHTNSERVNVERLRAHAVEAAEQCGLVFAPEVAEPASLEAALAGWPAERRLYLCDERRDAPPLGSVIEPGPAAVLIGPEGGFSDAESAALRAKPFVRTGALGPRVLRADTAAVAALTLWQDRAGDWR